MSPEVVNRKSYDQNIDVWSLGILLYELLIGYTPFNDISKENIMYNIRNKDLSNFIILVFNKDFNPQIKDLINNILVKK